MNHLLTSDSNERRRFRRCLLAWYDRSRRDLPWRRSRDPYLIWVSEVMLQQTRVGAVLRHYGSFIEKFPNVQSLARARLSAVLAAWSGLGYYRRARALHTSARELVRHHGGRLPERFEALLDLPGFGRYTAAAVASIAFGKGVAVVDGNVERVLRRLLKIPKAGSSAIWNAAEKLISQNRPGDFNQAMMELGATVCRPQRPLCPGCPVQSWCNTQGVLKSRRAPAARRSQSMDIVLARKAGRVLLVKRPESTSLMPGLWQLPATRTRAHKEPLLKLTHAIMNTNYQVRVIPGPARNIKGAGVATRWLKPEDALELPLTGLARKILQRLIASDL